VVPAHGVERYGDRSTHSHMPFWKDITLGPLCRGNPRK